jgi:hypothetical protein
VAVTQIGDLPLAVGGVRTLDALKTYVIYDLLNLGTDQINPNGANLIGFNRRTCGLLTSNPTGLIVAADVNLDVSELRLVNTGGPVFALTGGADRFIQIKEAIVVNAAQDTMTGAAGFRGFVARGCSWTGGASGIRFSGEIDLIAIVLSSFFDLTAPGNIVEVAAGTSLGIFTWNEVTATPAAGQTALYVDPGVIPSRGAGVTLSDFGLTGIPVGGWTRASKGVTFLGNQRLQNSTYTGSETLAGNTAVTATSGGAWVKINTNVSWVADPLNERLSVVNSDELQMDGVSPHRLGVDANVVLEGAVNNRDYRFRVRQFDASSGSTITVGAETPVYYRQSPEDGSIFAFADLETGDRLWIEVRHPAATDDVTVLSASLRAMSSS